MISDRLWNLLGLDFAHRPGRYTVLLISILALIVAQPFLGGHYIAQFMLGLLLSGVLLSALYTFESSRSFFVAAVVVMVPTFVCRWLLVFTATRALAIVASLSMTAFLMMTVIGLVVELFSIRRVTLDSISAAICAYLLMAVAWAFLFAVIEMEKPGSFSAGLMLQQPGRMTAASMSGAMYNFVYYSFVCLTTTGYGDIAPLSRAARLFSILESIAGQLYLAILIARLVSLEVAHSMMGDQ